MTNSGRWATTGGLSRAKKTNMKTIQYFLEMFYTVEEMHVFVTFIQFEGS